MRNGETAGPSGPASTEAAEAETTPLRPHTRSSLVADHVLAGMLGEGSPLARRYDCDADVLLLGVGHDTNTSLHLAEYRRPDPPRERVGAVARTADGGREWVWWEDVVLDSGDFGRQGAEFDATGNVRIGRVGDAQCRLMRQRAAVDFATDWMTRHRRNGSSGDSERRELSRRGDRDHAAGGRQPA